jgi:uncharacterized membrane protein YkoI
MSLTRFSTLIVLPLLFAPSARADETLSCLGKDQRQSVVGTGQVIPLATALAKLPGRAGEVVRARLCQGPKGYVYLLTLLARDGKVSRLTVDAKNGVVLNGR